MTTIHIVRTPMRVPPCMGGWCAVRERCARYQAASTRIPAERLCPKGSTPAFKPLEAA